MPSRFRDLILLGAFTSLRWGELVNVTRADVGLVTGTVLVARTLTETRCRNSRCRGHIQVGRRATAGSNPGPRAAHLTAHIAEFVDDDPTAFVFLGKLGGRLRRSNFRRAACWATSVRAVGLPAAFHFHDLRHTGYQLAAEAGATTSELMHRIGHSTVRAVMRYQHGTDRRDRDIAAEMSRRAIQATPASE